MSGDWVPMTSRILKDPKLIRISHLLAESENFKSWFMRENVTQKTLHCVTERSLRCVTHSLLTVTWVWAREHGKDVNGDCFVGFAACEDVDEVVGFRGFAAAMEAVGWLEKCHEKDGIVFPKFFKSMNFPKSSRERQKEYRERKKRENEEENKEGNKEKTVTKALHEKRNIGVTKVKESKTNIYTKEKERNKAKKDKEKLDTETPKPDEPPANGLVVKKTGKERKARVPTKLVEEIFSDWQQATGHHGAGLGPKRIEQIKAAVRMGYDRHALRQAFVGCARSSYHNGYNEANKRYTDIELILRNEKNIDRFRGYAEHPPQPTFKPGDKTSYGMRQGAIDFWQAACADARGTESNQGSGVVIDAEAQTTHLRIAK